MTHDVGLKRVGGLIEGGTYAGGMNRPRYGTEVPKGGGVWLSSRFGK